MSEKQNRGEASFFGGAAVLAAGILIVKIIGLLYKMPLANILGSGGGYTDFNAAFNVFNVLLIISTAGVPVAISKMVAEANARGEREQIHRIFQVAFAFFFAVGAVCSAVMFVGADVFANIMGDSKAATCMRALAPSVMLVAGLACHRGYAQGHRHMVPSSVSQIIESVFKLAIGLPLAWYAMDVLRMPDHMGAAAAIVGITASEVIALIYMAIEQRRFRRLEPPGTSSRTTPNGVILSACLALAVPITLTSASSSLITLVDNALVLRRLQSAGLMLTEDGARALMSNYSVVQTIYQIPAALMVAITASVIPAVTACFTKRDRTGAARIVGSSLKMAALVAMPSGAGMIVLGRPITQMLFPSYSVEVAGTILSILGLANIFVCLMLVCNSILQSHGVLHLPIVTMLMGGITMVLFDYFMVGTTRFNIFGSPIGTCICYAITCGLDLGIVHRIVPGCPSYHKVFGKILVASVAMGAAAWGVYGRLLPLLGNTLSVVGAALASGIVYLLLVVVLRVLSREDLTLMPKGDKIARVLKVK